MRQIFNLVKKDFLLAKRHIALIILFSIGAPIFMSKGASEIEDFSPMLYITLIIMLCFMIYHMISMEEMKEEGMIYIQTTPISNNFIGLAKFIVVFIVFMLVSLIYLVLSKIEITKVGFIGLKDILFAFLLVELFFSIYIPLTFKLGYVKLQMVSAGIIMVTPFLIGLVSKKTINISKLLIKLENVPDKMLITIGILMGASILAISTKISSQILDKKEY